MDKKKFGSLVSEAKKEFEEEKSVRVKSIIKQLLGEYEIAKATVTRIEKQMARIKKEPENFLLDYDGD